MISLRQCASNGAATLAAVLLLIGCGGGGGGGGSSHVVTAAATQYQINPNHSGYISFGQPLNFPSRSTWSVDLGGVASYPLIVGHKVFVTAAVPSGTYGTNLYALDEATGAKVWGPVSVSTTTATALITYDNGTLFVVNYAGHLQSFDATTGKAGWSVQLPGQGAFSAPPTALNGSLYVEGYGVSSTLFSLNESNGNVNWTAPLDAGGDSSPTLTTDGSNALFIACPCQAYSFNPQTGALLWHYDGLCDGGGGSTTAYANGQVYVPDITDSNRIFDATTGNILGTFAAQQIPALDATNGYFLNNNKLVGINLASKQALWSFAVSGYLNSAPIEVDQTVFIGTNSSTLYALNSSTGAQIWSAPIGSSSTSSYYSYLAAGEGYLAVSYGSRLTAWHLAGQ